MKRRVRAFAAVCCTVAGSIGAASVGVASAAQPTSTHVAAPSSDTARLVARVVDAYGGRAALERARVIRQEGTVTSILRGEAGRLVRVFERPSRLRVEIAYPRSGPEVRVVQGPYGNRDGREVSTGSPMHGAMVLQAARLALPLSLSAPGARVTDGGTAERDGRKVRLLALALPDGMQLDVEIDPATAHVVRSTGSMPVPGGRIEFATDYAAFRRFAGLLFATHEENWARGQHTGATELTKVEILRQAPPGAFDEPL